MRAFLAATLALPFLVNVVSCSAGEGRDRSSRSSEPREGEGVGIVESLSMPLKGGQGCGDAGGEKECIKRAQTKHKDALNDCKKMSKNNKLLCETLADSELDRDLIFCAADRCLFDEGCCDDSTCTSLLTNQNCGGCGLACRAGSTCFADESGVGECSCLPGEEHCPATGQCFPNCDPGRVFDRNTCACKCVPTTCAEGGANCGTISDGCGGTLNCGMCTAPQVCGGAGVVNQCGAQACPQGTILDVITQQCGGELLTPSDSDGYSFLIFTVPSNISSAIITANVTWASDWYPPPANETTQSGPNLVEVPFNGGSGCDHVWKHSENNFVNFDIDPFSQSAERVGSISVGPGKSVAIAGSDCFFGDNFMGNHRVKWWVTLNP